MILHMGRGNAWILKEFMKSAVLSKWKKMLITFHLTLKLNVTEVSCVYRLFKIIEMKNVLCLLPKDNLLEMNTFCFPSSKEY